MIVYGLKPGREKGEVLHTCWPLNGGFIACTKDIVLVLANMELHKELYCKGGLEENNRFENTMNFKKNGIFEELE